MSMSRPRVACPSIICGSLKGWMKVPSCSRHHASASAHVVCVACEDDVDVVFAEHFDLMYFLVRRRFGHEYGPNYAEFAAGERYALRVVACGGADYAARQLFGREAGDFVVRAADFVGAHDLHIFAFEPDVGSVALGEGDVEHERGVDDDAADALFGFLDVVELRTVVGHFTHLQFYVYYRRYADAFDAAELFERVE